MSARLLTLLADIEVVAVYVDDAVERIPPEKVNDSVRSSHACLSFPPREAMTEHPAPAVPA